MHLSTNKIHRLNERTINQIAAGEVIENPASVVKELVENAIDAGATQMIIEILAGGFQLIRISDNGTGMSSEDAVLSLERHATSKIISAEDLFSLSTMGFRGEALASIAAISKMQLTTALEDAPATAIEIEGGEVVHVGPAARTRGTTIEVRSLFYNVPARKKFQKSSAASSAEVTKTLTQLALAHPEVGMEFIQQQRTVFSFLPSQGEDFITLLKQRASLLLNAEFLHSCHALSFNEGNYQGQGLIADPLVSRHNRSGQYLFVNRRPVFCLPINYAIRDAYGTRLSADRHPVYVLHLTIPSSLVDVNVHPQKKEIRLREESMLKYALHGAVNTSLSGEHPVVVSPPFNRDWPSAETFPSLTAMDFDEPLCFKEETKATATEALFELNIQAVGLYAQYLLVEGQSLPEEFRVKAKIQGAGITWFDLPAIETRLHFDQMLQSAKNPQSQHLLLPLTWNGSLVEAQLLRMHQDAVQQLGLIMRPIGETAFIIEGVPPFLNEGNIQIVLEELIGELQGLERAEHAEKLRILAGCLSRKVRNRKTPYLLAEACHLVEKLLQSSDPLHCPQGKRTLFHFDDQEMQKKFTK
jgi:DNA mismatch repair protein MutL